MPSGLRFNKPLYCFMMENSTSISEKLTIYAFRHRGARHRCKIDYSISITYNKSNTNS